MKTIITVAVGFIVWRLLRKFTNEPVYFLLALATIALTGVAVL